MKTAILLHGKNGSPASCWFAWLKEELEQLGYRAWLPQLPNATNPNMDAYLKFIFDSKVPLDNETIVVGHSSGAVAALGLLSKIKTPVKAAYLVSVVEDTLGWEEPSSLFSGETDYEQTGRNAEEIIFVHSDNDPYSRLEQAERLSKQTGGELVIIPGQGHFNIENSPKYKKFPELLELIALN